jgi:DUF4097 and DUF4098 domain-containing protein YvlB
VCSMHWNIVSAYKMSVGILYHLGDLYVHGSIILKFVQTTEGRVQL